MLWSSVRVRDTPRPPIEGVAMGICFLPMVMNRPQALFSSRPSRLNVITENAYKYHNTFYGVSSEQRELQARV